MSIYEFKKEYDEKCTIQGLIGKKFSFIVKYLLLIVFFTLIILFIITLLIGRKYFKLDILPISAISTVCTYISTIIFIISLKKYQKRKEKEIIDNSQDNGDGTGNKEIKQILNNNFKDLLIKYNLLIENELNKHSNESNIDYMVKALNNYASSIKYNWIVEKAVIGSIILPIWLKLVDHIYSVEGIITLLVFTGLILILIILPFYPFIKLIIFQLLDEVANSESKQFYNLANKLEAYKYGFE